MGGQDQIYISSSINASFLPEFSPGYILQRILHMAPAFESAYNIISQDALPLLKTTNMYIIISVLIAVYIWVAYELKRSPIVE